MWWTISFLNSLLFSTSVSKLLWMVRFWPWLIRVSWHMQTKETFHRFVFSMILCWLVGWLLGLNLSNYLSPQYRFKRLYPYLNLFAKNLGIVTPKNNFWSKYLYLCLEALFLMEAKTFLQIFVKEVFLLLWKIWMLKKFENGI